MTDPEGVSTRMDEDVVTTVLELSAVVLLAVGLGLVVAALVGGMVGVGAGLTTAAVALGAASAVLRMLARPVPAAGARS